MKGTIQSLSLNMLGGFRADSSICAKQFDTNSRQLRIRLMANSEPWQLPFDCRVYLYVKKPDGTLVFNECGQEGENIVIAPLTEQTLAAAGDAQCELYVQAEDGDIKSQTFCLRIEKAVMNADAVESADEFGALQTRLAEIQTAIATTRDTAAVLQAAITEARESIIRADGAAEAANTAAGSIQVAVDAAEQAQVSKKAARAAADEAEGTRVAVRAYVEAEKASFAGYSKGETDRKYANALVNTATGTGSVTMPDAWDAPVKNLLIYGKSKQDAVPTPEEPQEIRSVVNPVVVSSVSSRNYIRNYTFNDGFHHWTSSSASNVMSYTQFSPTEGAITLSSVDSSLSVRMGINQRINLNSNDAGYLKLLLQAGDTLSMSAWYRYNSDIPNTTTSSLNQIAFRFYFSDGTYKDTTAALTFMEYDKWVSKSVVATIPEDCTFFRAMLWLGSAGKTGSLSFAKVFLGPGDTAVNVNATCAPEDIAEENREKLLPYLNTVHLAGYTLHGIGNVRDHLKCRDGVWGIERYCSVVDNDAWVAYNTATADGAAGHRYGVKLSDIVQSNYTAVLCSKYENKNLSSYNISGDYIVAGELGKIHVRTLHPDFDKIADFKAFMADAVTLYQLAELVWEPLPDAIQQQLNSLKTYQGEHSTVYVVSDVAPEVAVEYVQDSNKVVQNLRLDMAEQEIDILATIEQLKITNNLI